MLMNLLWFALSNDDFSQLIYCSSMLYAKFRVAIFAIGLKK